MTHQPEFLPDQPSPEQAARDAERAKYLERLREKLKALDFCAVEGFPHGREILGVPYRFVYAPLSALWGSEPV